MNTRISEPMRQSRIRSLLIGVLIGAGPIAVIRAEDPAPFVDVSGFHDVVKHWNDKYGRDRQDSSFTPDQVSQIADNLLLYQNPDGGWAKSLNPLLDVPPAELRALLGSSLERSTLDNRTTYTHAAYLAKAFIATGQERFRRGAERGVDYVLTTQQDSGGWRGADVDAITFNDDVMVGVMQLLRHVERNADHFQWIDATRRQLASDSLNRAIKATLKCQIVVDGRKTGWCQQHSHTTFQPVRARSYELPAICPVESSHIIRFLMTIENPSPEVVAAIEQGVSWINETKLTGIRVQEIKIEPVRFDNHTTTRDRVVVEDPSAPPIWARFYDIATNQPFFCNRDGIKVGSLAEVAQERRTGYGWYSTVPNRLLTVDYPAWKTERRVGGPSGRP